MYLIVNYALYQPLELLTGQQERQGRDSGETKPKEGKERTTVRRAPRGDGKLNRATWLTPYIETWASSYGTTPNPGKLAGQITRVHDELGAAECLARWTRYLASTPDVTRASAQRFAETHTAYASAGPVGSIARIPGARDAKDELALRRAGF